MYPKTLEQCSISIPTENVSKTFGFLKFSGGIEMKRCQLMTYFIYVVITKLYLKNIGSSGRLIDIFGD